MLNLRNKLPKWMVALPGDITDGRRGGSKSSSTELLAPRSGFTQERSNFPPPIWKPAWYTGWHIGVLYCATSVVVVLLINIGLTIYAATNPKYKMEEGVVTLYLGSCDKSKKIGMWLHLWINVLSTILLSGSNYTQQCLAAPTRSEIDAAHMRRRWMNIGVPSVRNLFWIKRERTLLWIAIGVTSIPLHLLYNSAVYNSIAANEFVVTLVTDNYFEQAAQSNATEALLDFYQELDNITDLSTVSVPMSASVTKTFNGVLERYNITNLTTVNIPMSAIVTETFNGVLEGYNTDARGYEDLTPGGCTKLYNTDYMSSHRNLFLITEQSSNASHNKTLLNINIVYADSISPSSWMCDYHEGIPGGPYSREGHTCNPGDLVSSVTNGAPWRIRLSTGLEVEISGCKSEKTPKPERCKVQFSLGIMVAVIYCNFVKACSMVLAVVRSREPTLVTLGDAVDSFLRIPDPTTTGMCFADRQFIKRGWKPGRRRPRRWKQKEVQRWWTSVSKTRWITCNFFCLIAIIAAGVLLRIGIVNDGLYWSTDIKSMWTRGFGKVNSGSLIYIPFKNINQAILLANLPQTILSFLYLTYNSLFTCMLSGHEWSLFSHHHRTLRVTSPRPGQRSTYWLQLPYTYAVPLMTLSGLLHWLTSQSIFLARVEIWDPLGRETPTTISTVGYSCIAIISALTLGVLALFIAAGTGYRRFAAETTTVGSCSAAISASCHPCEDTDVMTGKKVRWGDVGIVQDPRVRHLTFSSAEGVRKPAFRQVYAGAGERGE